MDQGQQLPTAAEIGEITALVAETMFAQKFAQRDGWAQPPADGKRSVAVQLKLGSTPSYTLRGRFQAAEAPRDGGRQSAAELSELLNIVAGQIKSRFCLAWDIGLPEAVAAEAKSIEGQRRQVCLEAKQGEAFLWIELCG
jgi:hypothetical protein